MPHPWMTLDTDYRDDYVIGIPADVVGEGELSLAIRWYVFPDGPALKAALATGEELGTLRLALGSLGD